MEWGDMWRRALDCCFWWMMSIYEEFEKLIGNLSNGNGNPLLAGLVLGSVEILGIVEVVGPMN